MKIKNLLLLVIVAVCSMNAFAQSDYKKDGIWYKIAADKKSGTVTAISGGMTDASAATITIPASFTDGDGNTVPVVGFEANWEDGSKSLGTPSETTKNITATTKTLNIDITNIKDKLTATTVSTLTKLETINLSGTLAADYSVPAFNVKTLDLTGLTGGKKIKVGDMTSATKMETFKATLETEIAANAFDGQGKIKTVELGGKAKVGANAFDGEATLEKFTVGGETTIGDAAFKNATGLKNFDLSNVKEIGVSAFEGCNKADFKTLTIPATIVKGKIGADAFKNMTSLETVTIENNNLEKVEAWFAGDNKIANITINSTSITKIEDNAFNVAPVKTLSITAPKLAEIGASAFAAYTLTKIDLSDLSALVTVDATSFPANAYTKVLLAGTKIDDTNFAYALVWLGGSAATLKTITLPGKITKVPANAFKNFAKLTEVQLTKNMTSIDADAFNGSGLTSIMFPAKLVTIDNRAFANCANLATVDFSEAAELTTINGNAFDNDPKLLALDLSGAAKLATIASTSFPANAYTSVKLSGTALNDANFQKFDFSGATASLTEATLPAGITSIPDNKFQGFTALTSVSIPKNVTSIGDFAFEGSALTAVKIREKVATIGISAFANCATLATVNFSEATGLTSIGSSAFEATAITEVAIPAAATVTYIGAAAFKNCKKLKSFAAKGWTGSINSQTFQNDEKLTGIVIPVGINFIGSEAFKDCKNLATVTFKYGEKDAALSGGNTISWSAFEGCAALTALDLSTTKLSRINSSDVFKGCTSLATITFPEELTSLNSYGLFSDCPIENFEATNLTSSSVLFGVYWDKTSSSWKVRDADNANTTLKAVKISGDVPSNCFAYCTALESVEYVDNGNYGDYVDDYAFEHCTALKTFTYNPERTIDWTVVQDDAFHGCVPFVQFVTNGNYMDYVVAFLDSKAPINATFGDAEVTKVKTVQDKANAKQFVAKYYNNNAAGADMAIDASEAKVYSIYVDGETAYFSACRTINGKYNITPGDHVIIKTDSEKEVVIEMNGWGGSSSVGFDDIYASKAGDDLADVQDGVNNGSGLSAGEYLYRLTNTEGQGFGFTFFNGTTIKEGQFFVACTKKPEGAGRLTTVWLDEDGNVEGEATGIKAVKNIDANDGTIYNLQGVRVDNPVKGGLYIQNGKKIVVK